MADDLTFPRIIYRGAPDVLGKGPHTHPETGELVGETKRCDSQEALNDDLKAGWRLTREITDAAAVDESASNDSGRRKARS